MTAIPQISVQLIHIQGPLKGEIQTFSLNEIRIGRHPDCEVQFPKDIVFISRQHARIVRVDNRFKLIDQSTNGCFVNGQRVTEAFLKDGDVITFAEGGPKVSFLTQTETGQAPVQTSQPPKPAPKPSPAPEQPPAAASEPFQPPPAPEPQKAPPHISQPQQPSGTPQVAIEKVKAPLAIQYGPALKSFQQLPITIGKAADCDFTINHPSLKDHHAQIFFAQGMYWIKDLTGSVSISLNGIPIQTHASLQADMTVSLAAQGPKFRFLGGGRLAEIEDQPAPKPSAPAPPAAPADNQSREKAEKPGKTGALFKKFFR